MLFAVSLRKPIHFPSRKISHARNHFSYLFFHSFGSGVYFISASPFSETAPFRFMDSRIAFNNVSGISRFSLAISRYASGLCRSAWRRIHSNYRRNFDLFDLPLCADQTKSSDSFTD